MLGEKHRQELSSFNIISSYNFIKTKQLQRKKVILLGFSVAVLSSITTVSAFIIMMLSLCVFKLSKCGCLLIGTPVILDWGYILLSMTSS